MVRGLTSALAVAISSLAAVPSAASAQQVQQSSAPADAARPGPADASASGGAPQQIATEQQPADIIVTAQRRSESLQKVPISVSVRTGEALLEQGKYSLRDILEDVPGITGGAAAAPASLPGAEAGGTDSPGAGLTIRGVPSSHGAGGAAVSTAPAVATYVDGIYEGVAGNYDIARVEVLRGPQGTLYGRSATSGVVAIHTRDPNLSRVTADGGLEIGNYDLSRLYGAVSVPLVADHLALRVAGNRYRVDGFENRNAGRQTSTDAKAKLLWEPSSDLSLLLGFALQDNHQRSGGRQIGPSLDPDQRVYLNLSVLPSENKFRQYWAELNWKIGIGTLTYIPGYRTWNQDAVIALVAQGNEVNTISRTPLDHFMTHELRLSSDSGSKLIWQVGSLYYDNKLHNFSSTILPALGNLVTFKADTRKRTREAGVFGEATYPLTDNLRVTAGLRYDNTKVDVQQDYTSITGVTSSVPKEQQVNKFNNLTYHGRIEGDLSPQSILYASLATGFSPGDVFEAANAQGVPVVVVLKAETLTSFEIGSKNSLMDGRLQVNGDVFYNHYGGYQNTISVNVSEFHSYNVPLRTLGGELEILLRPSRADRVGANLSYVHAHFFDRPDGFYTDYALPYPSGVVPFKANVYYEHEFALPGGSSLSLRGDANFISRRYAPFSGFNSGIADLGGKQYVHLPSEIVGNIVATWTSPSRDFTVSGYVRNVGGNRYTTVVNVLGVNGFTGALLPVDQWRYQPSRAEPRIYGVALGFHF